MLIKKVINPTLSFSYGTMSCGKSTTLLQLNFSLREMGFTPLLAKPRIDTRTLSTIKSRIGLEEDCLLLPDDDFLDIIENHTHILVDEAQFLDKEQILQLQRIVDVYEKEVHCFGLRTSYTGELFEGSSVLFAIADNLVELPLIYKDGHKTIMHIRYVDGKPIFDGDPIHVGDIDEDYESVSRKQYFRVKEGISCLQ